MAIIEPFEALRPRPDLAARICELPYDVMSSEEARQVAAGNPLSFLRVSKPEIDLPSGTDLYSPAVYAKGKENFQTLIQQGALVKDSQPGFYLYRQVMGKHVQTGLVAAASCEEYLRGTIKKHELTRPDKEDDRVRHIEALDAQTGPAFLTYPARTVVDDFVAKRTSSPPGIDFEAADGIHHSAWSIADQEGIRFLQDEFGKVEALYIADGHHRSAAAGRVFRARNGSGGSSLFLTVIFPHNQMQILAYNRVLKDLNGLTSQQLIDKLSSVFTVQPKGKSVPAARHQLGLYLAGEWFTLVFRPEFVGSSSAMEQLDVTLLQKHVLAPVFAIDDPRTSKRTSFVGGVRGTAELEKLVDTREYACAFSMFPTSIEDLMSIADAGGIMPPKSTWFEPKLRDGMFSHLI